MPDCSNHQQRSSGLATTATCVKPTCVELNICWIYYIYLSETESHKSWIDKSKASVTVLGTETEMARLTIKTSIYWPSEEKDNVQHLSANLQFTQQTRFTSMNLSHTDSKSQACKPQCDVMAAKIIQTWCRTGRIWVNVKTKSRNCYELSHNLLMSSVSRVLHKLSTVNTTKLD